MSKANGNGTATALAKVKTKKKLKARVASHYVARAWAPVKQIKPAAHSQMRILAATAPPPPPPPPPTSSVSATRYPTMLTLCYTLHSAQPITYVTVTITGIVVLPNGAKMAGQPQQVPVWSISLNPPSPDVSLPVTALALSQTPNTNPMLITITYDTASQQNIPAFTLYV